MTKKRVLMIGFDPTTQDFSVPEYASKGLTAEKILAGIEAAKARVSGAGYDFALCLIEPDTGEETAAKALSADSFDFVCIGAGVRTRPTAQLLFEKLINLVRTRAPNARICFVTGPEDTLEAIQRWG